PLLSLLLLPAVISGLCFAVRRPANWTGLSAWAARSLLALCVQAALVPALARRRRAAGAVVRPQHGEHGSNQCHCGARSSALCALSAVARVRAARALRASGRPSAAGSPASGRFQPPVNRSCRVSLVETMVGCAWGTSAAGVGGRSWSGIIGRLSP